jgi:hypothetical protein
MLMDGSLCITACRAVSEIEDICSCQAKMSNPSVFCGWCLFGWYALNLYNVWLSAFFS